ncbi:MAG: SGNH/GDSL hydrolase family protein [Gammaproteobacteria bacterium]
MNVRQSTRCAAALVLALGAGSAGARTIGIMGDSLSDTGNLSAALSSVSFGLVDIPSSDTYYQGRFSNGPIWVDYLESANPQWSVVSIAVGGAYTGRYGEVDNTGDNDFAAVPIFGGALQNAATGLASQRDSVPDLHGTDVSVVIWAGANDLLYAADLGYATASDIVTQAIANIGAAVDAMLAKGADGVYVVNMPDLGRTPRALVEGRQGELTAAASLFNQQLAIDVIDTAMGVRLIDVATPFAALLDAPLDFGFTNVTQGCLDDLFDTTPCADAQGLLFWDELHPTTAGHAAIAQAFQDALAPVPVPPALPLLAGGLALLWRRRSAA